MYTLILDPLSPVGPGLSFAYAHTQKSFGRSNPIWEIVLQTKHLLCYYDICNVTENNVFVLTNLA